MTNGIHRPKIEWVKPFRWNHAKNEFLASTRGITFERIVVAVANGGLLDVYEHRDQTKYPGHRVMVVVCDGYAYLVPYVDDADHAFLKTVIPSRKATRDYLDEQQGGSNDPAG